MKTNIFVFDVESTSLHGTGFAVGAVVYDSTGYQINRFELLSHEGMSKADQWVKDNIIPFLTDMPTCSDDYTLRQKFFEFYMKYKETAEIWSDCNFPVETNFLSAIVKDDPGAREFSMPYPLKDISTLVDIRIDRIQQSNIVGLRKHNPLDDAIASAQILLRKIQNLNILMKEIDSICRPISQL